MIRTSMSSLDDVVNLDNPAVLTGIRMMLRLSVSRQLQDP